jgi:hypothetical protein
MFIKTTAWIVCSTIETTNQQKNQNYILAQPRKLHHLLKSLKRQPK